uniref:Constitutive photomorphogenesis protein 10 n=1 Tax=Nelumbo nucifera TaxID=4432 RepID=A0A822YC05_NELNU|nr:TPA_asm: hypothetical protein HUJ06_031588 [Nelumbo nucifera]
MSRGMSYPSSSAGIGAAGLGGGVGGRSWPSTTSVSASGKRIQKEIQEFNMDPPTDCSAGPKGDNLYQWISTFSLVLQAGIPLFLSPNSTPLSLSLIHI